MNAPAITRSLAVSAAILMAQASIANSQSSGNRWTAFFGCWHARGAPVREQLCIVPAGDGARMITIADGATREESRVIADGRARDVVQDDCRGSERARWSSDRRRVFLNADLDCGDGRRISSGLMAFTNPTHWVSVQAVSVDGQTATRSTEYELASSSNLPRNVRSLMPGDVSSPDAARAFAAGDVSDDDVDEAADFIADAAVQEWLRASGAEYDVMPGSALSQLNRDYGSTVVVERPVYVERTRVVRCWDPFWGGFVVGVTRHVGVAVNVGSSCGDRYYTRYSPWGYDLYGWHTYRPVVFVNSYPRYSARPVIIRGGSNHYRDDRYRNDRYRNDRDRRDNGRNDHFRDDNGRRDRSTESHRNDSDRDRAAVTRGGYTRSDDRPRESGETPRGTGHITRNVERSQTTTRTSAPTAEGAERSSENRAAAPRHARSRN